MQRACDARRLPDRVVPDEHPHWRRLAVTKVGIGVVLVAGMIVDQQLSNSSSQQTELARDQQFVIADLLSASVALQQITGTREIRLTMQRETDQALAGLREGMGDAVQQYAGCDTIVRQIAENCERLESLVKLAKDYRRCAMGVDSNTATSLQPLDRMNTIGTQIDSLIERVTYDAGVVAFGVSRGGGAVDEGQQSASARDYLLSSILVGAAIFGVL